MRIHRLQIQAFGPFVQRQEVDFDRLGAQGLFLLEGATGAGKSSVLDAICFALFASVPGVRQSGHRLRSDHAPAELAPEVVLDFSIAGRYLRIVRSPAWHRPAKRGSSTVRENAQALLSEKLDGEWGTLSSRNDEAAHQIESVLGMNREQFTKVVMLAQGEFAAFLRADIKERQVLLQKLFGTERFTAVERQLAESAGIATKELQAVQQQLMELLQAARLQAAEYLPVTADSGAAGDGGPERAALDFDGILAALLERQQELRAEAEAAASRAGKAVSGLQADEDLVARHAELAAAECAGDLVRSAQPQIEKNRTTVAEHHRAQGFSADLERLQAAEVLAAQRHGVLAAARAELGSRAPAVAQLAEASLEGLEAASREITEASAVVRSMLPEEAQLLRQRLERDQAAADLTAAEAASGLGEERIAELQLARAAALSRLESTRRLAGHLEARSAALQLARVRRDSGIGYRAAGARAADLSAEVQDAQTQQLTAKARWLHLLQERLERAAGELAAQLVDGQPCPVCGGVEHPEPSGLQGASFQLAADEEVARAEHERCEELLNGKREALHSAATEAAGYAALGGDGDPEELEQTYALALEQEREAAGSAELLIAVSAQLQTAERELQTATELLLQSQNQGRQLRASLESIDAGIADRASKISELLAAHASLSERLAELERDGQLIHSVISAVRQAEQASAQLQVDHGALELKLTGSGFRSIPEIAVALRGPEELARLEAEFDAYRADSIRAEQALAADRVSQAARERASGTAVPHAEALTALRADVAEAEVHAQQAILQQHMCARAISAVESAARKYAELELNSAQERRRSELLTALAETSRGLGENHYKMPLSAYVLAARLEQVAEAASERLQVMSDGRYLLAHTDALAGGNRKSGLGLDVVDGWTGQSRDTATLSGGESFMASLALALGLADVVQRESGGLRIDTLFVDEGFGSLDEESLEMVMTSLEGLRDTGRTVGLVSHVAELKLRIPQQLHVRKGRQGSTLDARILDRLE